MVRLHTNVKKFLYTDVMKCSNCHANRSFLDAMYILVRHSLFLLWSYNDVIVSLSSSDMLFYENVRDDSHSLLVFYIYVAVLWKEVKLFLYNLTDVILRNWWSRRRLSLIVECICLGMHRPPVHHSIGAIGELKAPDTLEDPPGDNETKDRLEDPLWRLIFRKSFYSYIEICQPSRSFLISWLQLNWWFCASAKSYTIVYIWSKLYRIKWKRNKRIGSWFNSIWIY